MVKIARSQGFNLINAKLPELDRGELEALRTRIGALLHLRGDAPDLPAIGGKPDQGDNTFVLVCLSEALARIGIEHTNPAVLARVQSIGAFRKKVPDLMLFLRKNLPDRRAQRATLMLGFELLYKNMCSMGVAISGRTLMNNIHRIPSIIDREFPGYASAGYLSMLFIQGARQKEHGNVREKRSHKAVSSR
jgi:hypothetical protein